MRRLSAVLVRPARWCAAVAVCVTLVAGCTPTIKVEAPDKPIVINLNIKIEQEVRVRIDRELDQEFSDNPELFN